MVNREGIDASETNRGGSTRHVVILGEMGVGKTTVGRLVARRLNRLLMDSDDLFEGEFGTTVATYAQVEGVAALHDQELRLFFEMVSSESPAVIAPAASIIEDSSAREALTACWVVWLQASSQVAMGRIRIGDHRRTIDSEEFHRLRNLRQDLYEQIADYEIDTDSRTPDELADQVVGAFELLH